MVLSQILQHQNMARSYQVRFILGGDFVQLEIQYLVSEPFRETVTQLELFHLLVP